MCLLGLAGLGLETGDKFLQVRDLVLLLGKGVLLQFHLFGAHVLELAVVAAVAHQLGSVYVQRDIGDGVEKFAVVADDDQGALKALEPGLQPHQRVQVQVVGRLVKQQQVGRTHQRARELQPHPPSARKAVHRVVEFGGLEAQTQDQRLRARVRVVGAGVLQLHVRVGHPVAIVAGFRLQHLALRCEQSGVAVDDEIGRPLDGLGHVLRHLPHAPLRGHAEVACVLVQRTVEQREQRGFSGAVTPDQADLFAGIERDRGAVEQRFCTAAQRDIFQVDHGFRV